MALLPVVYSAPHASFKAVSSKLASLWEKVNPTVL
jgi:hypothetical protein